MKASVILEIIKIKTKLVCLLTIVDLSQLLINNNGNLQEFITVKDTQAGVVMSVDRDGSNQSTYHSQELILLTGKHYTLEDLMASNAFIH